MLSHPTCKQCKQPIWGNYINALGANWHPEHFLCAACHKPILDASFNTHEDMPYHSECFRQQVAPRCAYCGKPLMKEYLVDYWGTMYCKEHQGRYPTCAYCGRLVPSQQVQRVESGDNICCTICRANAIETIDQARPIFSRLIKWVNNQGLVYNNLHLSLELDDRQKLGKLITGRTGTAGIHSQGVTLSTTHTLNGKVTRTEVDGIAVLEGMPALSFQGVTIHELGHVWLVVHGVKDLPLWAEEGFCELLTHRYYIQLNTNESLYHAQGIETNPDSVYGGGFRRVRAIADSMGFLRFVETLQKTKRLPSL
jgi:LIM domain-containing protein/protein DA1